MDATPASRTHCSECPSFVSFRSSEGIATVGCSWGEDMVAWLRHEMAVSGTHRRSLSGPRRVGGGAPGRLSRPRPPRRRPGLAPGTSLGLFLAALGVGMVLSALEPTD